MVKHPLEVHELHVATDLMICFQSVPQEQSVQEHNFTSG